MIAFSKVPPQDFCQEILITQQLPLLNYVQITAIDQSQKINKSTHHVTNNPNTMINLNKPVSSKVNQRNHNESQHQETLLQIAGQILGISSQRQEQNSNKKEYVQQLTKNQSKQGNEFQFQNSKSPIQKLSSKQIFQQMINLSPITEKIQNRNEQKYKQGNKSPKKTRHSKAIFWQRQFKQQKIQLEIQKRDQQIQNPNLLAYKLGQQAIQKQKYKNIDLAAVKNIVGQISKESNQNKNVMIQNQILNQQNIQFGQNTIKTHFQNLKLQDQIIQQKSDEEFDLGCSFFSTFLNSNERQLHVKKQPLKDQSKNMNRSLSLKRRNRIFQTSNQRLATKVIQASPFTLKSLNSSLPPDQRHKIIQINKIKREIQYDKQKQKYNSKALSSQKLNLDLLQKYNKKKKQIKQLGGKQNCPLNKHSKNKQLQQNPKQKYLIKIQLIKSVNIKPSSF